MVRQFHIGDVLSALTGLCLSPDSVKGVHNILTYITGQPVYIHDLRPAIDACAPHILAAYPQLAAFKASDVEGVTYENRHLWLAEQAVRFGGEMLNIEPLPAGQYQTPDPLEIITAVRNPKPYLPN